MIYNVKTFFKKRERSRIISIIIDREVWRSEGFGLVIRESDIKREKKLFDMIFLHFWDDIKGSDNRKYGIIRQTISKSVYFQLNDLLDLYYDDKASVKNKYNCHIDAIMSSIMLKISN